AMAHVLGNQPVLTSQFKSNIFSMRSVTANVSGGASIYARSQSHFKKRAYFKHALHYNIIYEGKDRKSTRLNSSHVSISYAVFCLLPVSVLFPYTSLFRSQLWHTY